MGLYLMVLSDDEELDGVDVGYYRNFDEFRDMVKIQVEDGVLGSRFKTLQYHSDCDGEWSPEECGVLIEELEEIRRQFMLLPPVPLEEPWKAEVARLLNLSPTNLDECFFDVDGEPLTERLLDLAQLSVRTGLPILFQ